MRQTILILALFITLAPAAGEAQIADDTRRQAALQHYRTGQELYYAEQFEKAIEAYDRAIEQDSMLALAHYGRGQSFMALKRYASAIQAFTSTRETYRRMFGQQQSGAAQLDRRAEDEIRELRDTVRALQSGRMKTSGGVGSTIDTRVAALENRIRDLERARLGSAGTFQTPAEVSLALGSAYFRNGNAEEAEREWKAAVSVNPGMGEAHNNLAVIYLLSKRKPEAEAAVTAAEKSRFRVNPQLKEDIQRLP